MPKRRTQTAILDRQFINAGAIPQADDTCRSKTLAALVILTIAGFVLPWSCSQWTTPSVAFDGEVNPARAMALTPHDPIFIDGDLGFTNASGVVWGDGTISDPYVIASWDINASKVHGIFLRNVTAHFVIRACDIHDGRGNQTTGIYFDRVTNGTIRDNNCSSNWYGMYLSNSSCGNVIVNNTCSNNRYDGIELNLQCDRNNISSNTFIGNLDGIHLEASSFNVVDDNVMVDDGFTMIGYVLQQCTTNDIGSGNTVNGRPVYYYRNQTGMTVPTGAGQVVLANCTDFVIEDQNIENATAAIQLHYSSNVTVRGNRCSNNTYGMLLYRSDRNLLANNTIHNNDVKPDDWWYGIGLSSSANNTIRENIITDAMYALSFRGGSHNNAVLNNSCERNSYGVYLYQAYLNSFSHNRIGNSTYYGVSAFSSHGNLIWNNSLVNNNGATDTYDPAHVQAYDMTAANLWNNTYGAGNYWSDWTAPDANGDGIVDLPYRIDGIVYAWDYHPLANYPPAEIPEFGSTPLLALVAFGIIVMVRWIGRRNQG